MRPIEVSAASVRHVGVPYLHAGYSREAGRAGIKSKVLTIVTRNSRDGLSEMVSPTHGRAFS